ncbi:ARP2/3 complex 20 kDa subunit (ARPC4), putative [Angomonas deanei]|uniref:ARP2/3 complex 20 kDa subunit (ARPC4), putative n=1 Tax=Angomonas deanei TaxID=59799 RepID=A0A7G2C275_9TRYP|nr:ARP2/3 complex 20 kDa subunit (ARPC4), putative [Angomonas deanei]
MTCSPTPVEDFYSALQTELLRGLCLQPTLDCLGPFEIPQVERYEAPSPSETEGYHCHLIHSEKDKLQCAIERTPNSLRCSFKLLAHVATAHDGRDLHLTLGSYTVHRYIRLLQESPLLPIQRAVPVADYHVSFLILSEHVTHYGRQSLVDSIVLFVQRLTKDSGRVSREMTGWAEASAEQYFSEFVS